MTVEDELNHFELYLERQGIGTKMKSIRLQQNSIQIGRGGGLTVLLTSDYVSRRHCEITVSGNKLFIKDSGSVNGTFVNDTRISGLTEIVEGDIIGFGCNPSIENFLDSEEYYVYKLRRPDVIDLLSDDSDTEARDFNVLMKTIEETYALDRLLAEPFEISSEEEAEIDVDKNLNVVLPPEKLNDVIESKELQQTSAETASEQEASGFFSNKHRHELQKEEREVEKLSNAESQNDFDNEGESRISGSDEPRNNDTKKTTHSSGEQIKKNNKLLTSEKTNHEKAEKCIQLCEIIVDSESSDSDYELKIDEYKIQKLPRIHPLNDKETLECVSSSATKLMIRRKSVCDQPILIMSSAKATSSENHDRYQNITYDMLPTSTKNDVQSITKTNSEHIQRPEESILNGSNHCEEQDKSSSLNNSKTDKSYKNSTNLHTKSENYNIPKEFTTAHNQIIQQSVHNEPQNIIGTTAAPSYLRPTIAYRRQSSSATKMIQIIDAKPMPPKRRATGNIDRPSTLNTSSTNSHSVVVVVDDMFKKANEMRNALQFNLNNKRPNDDACSTSIKKRRNSTTVSPAEAALIAQCLDENPATFISKHSLEEIKIMRREKLRQINERDAKEKQEQPQTRIITKPKVKYTETNRGSFLTQLEPAKPITRKVVAGSLSSNSNDTNVQPDVSSKTSGNEKENSFLEISHCQDIIEAESTVFLDQPSKPQPSTSAGIGFHTIPNHSASNSSNEPLIDIPLTTMSTIYAIKSILSPVNKTTKSKNSVRFRPDEELEEVRFYERHNDSPTPLALSSQLSAEYEVINDLLSWEVSWLYARNAENTVQLSWNLTPMLQSYTDLVQYKRILIPIMKTELLAKLTADYSKMLRRTEKWDLLCLEACRQISPSRNRLELVYENKESLRTYSQGTLLLLEVWNSVTMKTAETFGYISLLADRNDSKQYILVDVLNNAALNFTNSSHIKSRIIAYVRADMKSFLALENISQSPLLDNFLHPENNQPIVSKLSTCYCGILKISTSQQKVVRQIAEDFFFNSNATIIAIEGGPGSGKTKTIIASILNILQIADKKKRRVKILVCAMSNACIDGIGVELYSLTYSTKWCVVRTGNQERISNEAKIFSLNEQARCLWQHNRNEFKDPKAAQRNIIQKADVVLTTINSSFELRDYNQYFGICFLDEASQATDAELIIPMQTKFKKLVLVGDTKQLQPVVKAMELRSCNFDQSLFSRIFKAFDESPYNERPILTLNTQFRMHPEIFKFPNEYFYNGRISSDMKLANRLPSVNLKPYLMLNISFSQNMTQDTSPYNIQEVRFIAAMQEILIGMVPDDFSIGIITPYLRQKDEFLKFLGENNKRCQVYTIDQAQGLEKDVIIISIARTYGIGFLSNPQRLNVALTRAKRALYICGNFALFKSEFTWKKLIDDATRRHLFHDVTDLDDEHLLGILKAK